jgi:hypothetical protein
MGWAANRHKQALFKYKLSVLSYGVFASLSGKGKIDMREEQVVISAVVGYGGVRGAVSAIW